MRNAAATAVLTAVVAGAASAPAADIRYDDPAYCSRALAMPTELAADQHRRCVIAIASAYLDAEADPALGPKAPIAEDAARHLLGRAASHGAPGRAGILAALDQSFVASIKNRRWSVEGDVAYVIYDAALRTDPRPTAYAFAERIAIEAGKIKDILLLAPSGIQ